MHQPVAGYIEVRPVADSRFFDPFAVLVFYALLVREHRLTHPVSNGIKARPIVCRPRAPVGGSARCFALPIDARVNMIVVVAVPQSIVKLAFLLGVAVLR